MPQLDNEQKTGLLLSPIDDEDDDHEANEHLPMTGSNRKKTYENDDPFPVVKKRPKTYQRHGSNFNHPVSFFFILLSAFLFGCLAGVVIMLYRMSQDAQLGNDPSIWMRVDSTMKNKLLKSIGKDNFLSWNRTVESDLDAVNRLEKQWKSFPTVFNQVERFSLELTLSKLSSSGRSSGVATLTSGGERELNKVSAVINQEYLTRSSLIKSGTVQSNRIYFLNYGRAEDLSELMEKNLIDWNEDQPKVAFMRRRSTLISTTEQIRQAIRYQFSALVLFDDDEQLSEDNQFDPKQRLTLAQELNRLKSKGDRQALLEGTTNEETEDENPIVVLILSKSDVEKVFTSIQSDAQQWLSPPDHWHERSLLIKLGGALKKTTLQFSSSVEEIPLQLPNLFGFVRGKVDPEHFLLVSFQLNNNQQEKVIEQILQTYEEQMKSGWQPRRSIVFSAWSGLAYDRHSIRSWMKKHSRLIDANLVAVLDLGQGVMGNSTLNLHGSPLFEQVVQRAADAVISPLKHDHACHKRQMPGMSPSPSATAAPSEEHHHHSRRHADEHQHSTAMGGHEEAVEECEQHKLFDEWLRASQNRLKKNQTWNFVQIIDTQSAAALFQLQQGIPALIVEMTEEKFIVNETFYQKRSISSIDDRAQPEVLAAYTQFVSEIIRQVSDEPLIPFNLTHYADLIDRQAKDFVAHYGLAYRSLNFNFGDPDDMTALITELTSAIRRLQSEIQQTSLDRLDILERLNQKLIQFERLFVMNNDKDPFAQTSKHLLFGSAFGFTNTIVPFPSLSNLLFDVPTGFQTELADTSKVRWSKLKEHVQLIQRTLDGFDGFRSPAPHH